MARPALPCRPPFFRFAVAHAVAETAAVVAAVPPLARLETQIVPQSKHPGKSRPAADLLVFLLEEAQEVLIVPELSQFLALRLGRIVAGDLRLVRVQPRQDRSRAGAAEARGDIPPREDPALRRSPVEVRRADTCGWPMKP